MGEHPPLLTPQGPGIPRARRPGFPRVEDSRTSRVPSSFPDSLGIAPLFAVSASRLGSHHFFPRLDTGSSTGLPALVTLVFPSASFPFLPLPCVQFSPVLSTFRYSFLHGSLRPCSLVFLLRFLPVLPLPCVRFPSVSPLRSPRRLWVRSPPPSACISSGWFLCLGCVFPFLPLPCVQFFPVRLRFPQLPLRFLLLPSPSFPFLSSSSLRFSPLSSASFSRRLPAH